MNIINIGILAHVDAGKTTITENLLYKSGAIKTLGRVDSGNTHTDTMSLEKSRGITIKASTISYNWKGVKVNIIDTPGHVDFVAEVERSLSVLDGAILVISAREGVQSHTKVLYDVLKELSIPILIFINKLDRIGADSQNVIKQMQRGLSDQLIILSRTVNEGSREVGVVNIADHPYIEPGCYEALCNLDDVLLEKFVSEEAVSREAFRETLRRYTVKGQIDPVFMGAGISGLGIEALLDGVNAYLPVREYDRTGELSGIVYKIARDLRQQKATYIRLYSGCLTVRDSVQAAGRETKDRVTRIQIFEHGKSRDAESVKAGDIGIIYGLESFRIGDPLGQSPSGLRRIELAKPTLKKKVIFADEVNKAKVFHSLSLLTEEDPLLDVELDPLENEIYIKIFGEVQMEIIRSLILEQYGLPVTFSESTTIYKETPLQKGVAAANFYEKGNPYKAAVRLEVEPLGRGEGVRYVSRISWGYLTRSFQKAVEDGVYEACKKGLYGWEVTDVLITLTDAVYDSVSSTPADFRNLTSMIFLEALSHAQTRLLEPVYRFEVTVPGDVAGRTMSDLQSMRAEITEMSQREERFAVKGLIPIDTAKDYAVKLASYTEGKGILLMRFARYDDLPEDDMKERGRAGMNSFSRQRYLMEKANMIRSD